MPWLARALLSAGMDVTLIVDGANVMGSRADGWWRDRPGAMARLHGELATLAARGVIGPVPGIEGAAGTGGVDGAVGAVGADRADGAAGTERAVGADRADGAAGSREGGRS